MLENYDVIIIGSGPSGLQAANNFSRNNLKVLMIEESSYQLTQSEFSISEIQKKYRNAGQTLIWNTNPIALAEAKAIGGGLAINAGIFQLVNEETFNKWKTANKFFIDYGNLLNSYNNICIQNNIVSDSDDTLYSDTINLKYNSELIENWNITKVPVFSFLNKNNFYNKVISSLSSNKGHLISSARVKKLFKIKDIWQVEVIHNNKKIYFNSKIIVFAAGTLQTPQILHNSNLLDKSILTLKYHPIIKLIASFPNSKQDHYPFMSNYQIKKFEPNFTLGSSLTTKSLIMSEILKINPEILNNEKYFYNLSKFKILYCSSLINEKTYFLLSNNKPFLISFKKQLNFNLKNGIKKLIEFSFLIGADKIVVGNHIIEKNSHSNYIENVLKYNFQITTVHHFSSLINENQNFIDSDFQLKNNKGVFILDSSILPGSPGTNPMGTIMCLSDLISENIIKNHIN